VGPFFIELSPEAIESELLRFGVGARWTDGSALERLMHALVCPVLLGPAGVNALMLNAEAHPPDVELGEAVDPASREGDAVIGSDRTGQTVGPKSAL
jgi:hypothetical protein